MVSMLLSEVFPPRKGGSGRWFYELYRRLPRERFIQVVGEDPHQADFDRTHDLRLQRLPLSWGNYGIGGWRDYLRTLRTLRTIVKKERVTSLHCGRAVPEGWLGWLLKKLCGISYCLYVHGEEVNLSMAGATTGVMASRQYRWLTRRALFGAKVVIANSLSTQRILLDGWKLPEDRVKLLYPGVDAQRYVPVPRNLEIRAKLGWHDRPVVLTVGRLQKRKGQDQMILALREMRKTIPNILYAILGEGEERADLEALAAREQVLEQVQFRGETDDADLLHCYQQCDLFALPNRQIGSDIEGFGMVLVEAQACGKPVLAGMSGGTAETMRSPETGLVLPCETPDALAHTIPELLRDPERLQRMGRAARTWVVEHLDWQALSLQAEKLFTEVER